MAEIAKMCCKDYGLKQRPITTRNPQSNVIIERIHNTIRNIIRKVDVKKTNQDQVNNINETNTSIMVDKQPKLSNKIIICE